MVCSILNVVFFNLELINVKPRRFCFLRRKEEKGTVEGKKRRKNAEILITKSDSSSASRLFLWFYEIQCVSNFIHEFYIQSSCKNCIIKLYICAPYKTGSLETDIFSFPY